MSQAALVSCFSLSSFRHTVFSDWWNAKYFSATEFCLTSEMQNCSVFCVSFLAAGNMQCATDTAVGLCFSVRQDQKIVWFAVGCLRSSFAVVIGIGMILVVSGPPSDSLPTSPNQSWLFEEERGIEQKIVILNDHSWASCHSIAVLIICVDK